MNPVLAIGLNPAWQNTLVFPSFHLGEVNRADERFSGASGKAVNLARAARAWGKRQARVVQFVGGDTGRKICRELDRESIEHVTVRLRHPTRTCTTCLDPAHGSMTELIEPSCPVPASAMRRLWRHLHDELPGAVGVALCGTFPPGVPDRFYGEVVKGAGVLRIPVLLDAWREVGPALAAGPEILKVNRSELSKIVGGDDLGGMCRHLLAQHPVRMVAVTDGPRDAWLATREKSWRFVQPSLSSVVSPLGAGDTVSAVFFSEFLAGVAPPQAFAAGLAAGAASCLTRLPALFDLATADGILASIQVVDVASA
jgi:fructose-1-phosphate kinase PfkB-like protein